MGTFTAHRGTDKVGLSKQKFPLPFPGQQFAKIPYYLRFLSRLYLCTKVLMKMQPKPEKERGTRTSTRAVHAAVPHPPLGQDDSDRTSKHFMPLFTTLTFSHAAVLWVMPTS